jgi:ribonucleoside-diphosphate reductase alpha chain
MNLSENAVKVLEARYLRRDRIGQIVESPEELFDRVARGVAHAELLVGSARQAAFWEEEFRRMLFALDFVPNSPTLMNAGTPLGQLSACFVLPVHDTTEGIFDAVKQMALVQRTGGGTGFSFSRLRPKGDPVASTGGQASGPVSFMNIFDCTTENIKQGGKRRGANMGILRVDHPDIMEFITAKYRPGRLENFNISVSVSDAFMRAVENRGAYDVVHPRTHEVVDRRSAPDVFDAIVQAAWRTADPGLIFLDTINRTNPTPHIGRIEATNPCGEIPLLPYESCNLGSLNLAQMLKRQGTHTAIDWQKFETTVHTAVRFLDDVIEVGRYPIPAIDRMTRGNRKIGLGVMGLAEMFLRLGVSYHSTQAVKVAEQIAERLVTEAWHASEKLAEERGVYGNWPGSMHESQGIKRRNATCTAVAPTGTIGIIADTSPSIEPLFALAYRRSHVLEDQTLIEINSLLREHAAEHGLDVERLAGRVAEEGRLAAVDEAPDELKRLFVTALEIPHERHLQIQAAFQRHVDNSVSKTINLPQDATEEEIAKAYHMAWQLGLKGVTVYRYGSKGQQVLELGAEEEAHHYDYRSKCDPEECKV